MRGSSEKCICSSIKPALPNVRPRRIARRITIVQSGLGAGGTEKIVSLLARHLDGQGHEVTVLAIKDLPSESYYPMPTAVSLRTMEEDLGKAAAKSKASHTVWLRKAMRDGKPDLVISFLTKINVQVAIAAIGLGVRRIAPGWSRLSRADHNHRPIHAPVSVGRANLC
ncbi:glycosyltransferase [Paracoccus benzoatiresistens]|uniref:glycosyltransferase n=1 Tax=Paracoccus benzoatiresistens TaxID=2997341 RepID=UPI0035300BB6